MMNYFLKKIQQARVFTTHAGVISAFAVRLISPYQAVATVSTTPTLVNRTPTEIEATLSASAEEHLFNPHVITPDRKVQAVLTAYSSTRDQTDDDPFTAASGRRVYDGMIAANWLPFGTKVKIPALFGNKIFTVDDRMNARYGFGRIDVWLDAERKQVNAFGVRRTMVEIYIPSSLKTPLAKSVMAKQIARR